MERVTLSVSNWTSVGGSLQSGTVNYQWWKTGQIDPVSSTPTNGNGAIQVDVAGEYYGLLTTEKAVETRVQIK